MKAKIIYPIRNDLSSLDERRYAILKSLLKSDAGIETLVLEAEKRGDYELVYLIETFDHQDVPKSLARLRRWILGRRIGIIGISSKKLVNGT
jgi:hypothetical protein